MAGDPPVCATSARAGEATTGGGFTATLAFSKAAAGTAMAARAIGSDRAKACAGTTVAAVRLTKGCASTCGGAVVCWLTVTLVIFVILVTLTLVMLTLRI